MVITSVYKLLELDAYQVVHLYLAFFSPHKNDIVFINVRMGAENQYFRLINVHRVVSVVFINMVI